MINNIEQIVPRCSIFQIVFLASSNIKARTFDKDDYERARMNFLMYAAKNKECALVGIENDIIHILDMSGWLDDTP